MYVRCEVPEHYVGTCSGQPLADWELAYSKGILVKELKRVKRIRL
jgi:hypothetical protein